MQYTLAKEFLYKIYSPLEDKIIAHQQAHIILRVIAATIGHTLDIKNICEFINSHVALKGLFGECSEKIVHFHLNRLKNIGVIMEHASFV
jgi:hypothetical protein